jgi:hypothetical protein
MLPYATSLVLMESHLPRKVRKKRRMQFDKHIDKRTEALAVATMPNGHRCVLLAKIIDNDNVNNLVTLV